MILPTEKDFPSLFPEEFLPTPTLPLKTMKVCEQKIYVLLFIYSGYILSVHGLPLSHGNLETYIFFSQM